MDFSYRLLSWYHKNGRSLPWRDTEDAYHIWVSEIILQQTRVDQGIHYYYRFIDAFPDVYSLSAATEDQVLRLWQGLGYYSRARNLHKAAREIAGKHGGILPGNSKDLEKLSGIGPYTAAAIASMAFKEVVPALDSNVYRVLSRLFAVSEAIDTVKGRKIFNDLSRDLISHDDPGGFNQAMMDFGSLVCKPANPDCMSCIFRLECLAYKRNAISRFPVRHPKKVPVKRYFVYAVLEEVSETGEQYFFVQKRTRQDIWKHMHEFPLLEKKENPIENTEAIEAWLTSLCGNKKAYTICGSPLYLKHQLTHQTIHAYFIRVRIHAVSGKKLQESYMRTTAETFDKLAKPRLIERFLDCCF